MHVYVHTCAMHFQHVYSDRLYDAREKTALGQVRAVKPWKSVYQIGYFPRYGSLRGVGDGKISSPPASAEDRKPRFSAIGSARALRIFAYREMFNFRSQKVAGIPLIAVSCSSVSNAFHIAPVWGERK